MSTFWCFQGLLFRSIRILGVVFVKKLISILSAICMVVTILPFSAYASSITPEISLEEFSEQLQEMQTEYDDTAMFSTITIKNETEFYHIDGEEYILEDNGKPIKAEITDNDFEIPLSAIEPYCELPEISTYSMNENTDDITVDKETAEAFGFEVDIEADKAV